MYRNYDFGYGGPPPPRRRVPDYPFDPGFRRGFVDPYFADPFLGMPDPYLGMPDPYMTRPRPMGFPGSYPRMRPPRPRLPARGGISDWGTQFINKQIKKTEDKILEQYDEDEVSTETAKSDADAKETGNDTEKSDSSTQKGTSESTAPQPAIPIGPRIPAKQMWESSYREKVSEQDEAASLMPPPPPKINKPPEPKPTGAANKRKQKNNKFRPYFKRKKKAENNTESSEDVNGNTVEEAQGSDGTTFPRMCKVCNVQLTGEEQAKIHNESEVHKRNVNKFLTGDNKKAIKMTLEKLNETMPLPTNTPDCLTWVQDTGDRTLNTVRFCRLCSVRMTSLQNAKQHYAGKSHAKRIRNVQRGHRPHRKPFQPTPFISGGLLGMQAKQLTGAYSYSPSFIQAQPQTNQPMSSINLKPVLPGDFANSMTPSGQYYCQTCKIVIEHAGSLNAHLQSKAHKLAKARAGS